MLTNSKSFLGYFRESVGTDEESKDILNGTQTVTKVTTENGDNDRESVSMGTRTVTGVPKEANDADPSGFGPTILPRKMSASRRAIKY
ncbi:MAG TPA: hypothetical protein VK914_13415 [bacterium]|jgi:hypothetical protein|nr:hypothetical protein [bacterium]